MTKMKADDDGMPFSGSENTLRESMPKDEEEDEEYESASNSNENLFQALQIFILRQNARLLRRLSLQASIATKDLTTFKRWIYQDYEQHRQQLKEAGANLFFRNESKDDIHSYDIVITFDRRSDPVLVAEVQSALQLAHPTFTVQHRKHYFANYVEQALYVSASDEFFAAYMPILFATNSSDDDENDDQHQKASLECSSLQRQTILHDILNQWHFEQEEGEVSSFSTLTKCLNSNKSYTENGLDAENVCTIDRLIECKVISQIFPLHYDEALSSLKSEWVYQFLSAQPLDNICAYFGLKIAIYFAFIGFYTKLLLYPSLFGLFITYFPYVMQLCHSNVSVWLHWCTWLFVFDEELLNDVLQFAFTIFNMFWSTIMLQKWEKRSRQHVASWSRMLPIEFALCGKLNSKGRSNQQSKRNSTDNAPFTDGRVNRILFKYCVTFPALGCSLAITFAIMFQIFHFQTWWDSVLIEKHDYSSWTRFIPKILLAIIINGSNCIYYFIAQWLNSSEKHSSAESRENNLITKLVLFQFLNSFLPLFYIAFYIMDVEKLKEQLAAQLITRQVIGNFNEAVWPFLKESYRIATRNMQRSSHAQNADGQNEKTEDKMGDVVSKGELESCMFQYESTFDDYLELVIQFGYVMLFAPVFPLAALCALINNILEIRSDAFKLCFVFQRPFATGSDHVRSIGECPWTNIFYYLSIVAIVTNCALMATDFGLISRVFGFTNSSHIILTSVAIEHALLLMKWLIPNLLLI